MINRSLVVLTLAAGSFSTAWADSAPELLGNLKAILHQTCGQTIEVHVAEMEGNDHGRMLIGLKNNQTGMIDLFASATSTAENKQYDKYVPVVFDGLSKTYIADTKERPDIVWGGAVTNLKGMNYSLALGSHVYQCGTLDKFAGEIANDLYGEAENEAN